MSSKRFSDPALCQRLADLAVDAQYHIARRAGRREYPPQLAKS
jgi:hypothetical protein